MSPVACGAPTCDAPMRAETRTKQRGEESLSLVSAKQPPKGGALKPVLASLTWLPSKPHARRYFTHTSTGTNRTILYYNTINNTITTATATATHKNGNEKKYPRLLHSATGV